MAFNGNESDPITLEVATTYTGNFTEKFPSGTRAHFFGKNKLATLLAQEGCMGIRAYYGIDENGNRQLVLVGATSDMEDQLDVILDSSVPCPNNCATDSPL